MAHEELNAKDDGLDLMVSPIGEMVPYYTPEELKAMEARARAMREAYKNAQK